MTNIQQTNPEQHGPFNDDNWVHVINIQKTRDSGNPMVVDTRNSMDFAAQDLRLVAATAEEASTIRYRQDGPDGNYRFQFSRHDRHPETGDLYIPADWLEIVFFPHGGIDSMHISVFSGLGYVHTAGFLESSGSGKQEKGYLYSRYADMPSIKRTVSLGGLAFGDEREWSNLFALTDSFNAQGTYAGEHRMIGYVPSVPVIHMTFDGRPLDASIPQTFELLKDAQAFPHIASSIVLEQLTAVSLAYVLNRKYRKDMLPDPQVNMF